MIRYSDWMLIFLSQIIRLLSVYINFDIFVATFSEYSDVVILGDFNMHPDSVGKYLKK